MRVGFSKPVMRALATTLFVCCCVAAASAQTIECLSTPKSESGWWSWREIDGRKCWYKKVGAVPPKSEFFWPEQAKEPPPGREAPQRSSSVPATEGMKTTLPRIEMARVKPVVLSDPNFRLADGRVGLMEGFSLSSLRGLGGAWEVPHHVGIRLDPFDARYGRW
jgi:hypothetical protein